MLKVMRSSKFFNVFILGFITIAITIVFVFWGIGPQENKQNTEVARLDNERISLSEYKLRYEVEYRRAREIYKSDEEIEKLNLRYMVLKDLIDMRVLLIAAKKTGLQVTNSEIQQAIMNIPAFQKDGVFDKNVYEQRMKQNRMTPGSFENDVRNDLLLNKIRRLVGETAEFTDEDKKTFESVKGNVQIIEMFLSAKKELAVNAFVEGLKRQIKITINDSFI